MQLQKLHFHNVMILLFYRRPIDLWKHCFNSHFEQIVSNVIYRKVQILQFKFDHLSKYHVDKAYKNDAKLWLINGL